MDRELTELMIGETKEILKPDEHCGRALKSRKLSMLICFHMTEPQKNRPIYAILGPTASGKTALGVELALAVGGEVINCDSVQIYKEIQIATAKPTEDEKRGIPHHLVDYVDPNINYTAGDWARDASQKIIEIEARGKIPVLVGGTGFYLRTLRQPLFESPKTDESIRQRLRSIMEKRGAEHLHRMLGRIDPVSAGKLFPRDFVRVTRALEVFFQTGVLFSAAAAESGRPAGIRGRGSCRSCSIRRGRSFIRRSIDARKNTSQNGLVDEVKRLREIGVQDDTNALGSHGYRRVCEYLRGERTLESAVEKTQQDVRNYAKRQLTWFRKESDAVWLKGFGNDERIREQLLEIVLNRSKNGI